MFLVRIGRMAEGETDTLLIGVRGVARIALGGLVTRSKILIVPRRGIDNDGTVYVMLCKLLMLRMRDWSRFSYAFC